MPKNKSKVLLTAVMSCLIATLISLQTCTNADAQTDTSFTTGDRFSIPSLSGEIRFAANGTYANATLIKNTWNFVDLKLNGFRPLETLAVSAQNSTILITSYRAGNATFRYAWLRYVAESRGQQTFNLGIVAGEGQLGLHPEWSVVVDNVWLGEGDGWDVTSDGTITVTGVIGNVSIMHYGFDVVSDDTSNLPFYERHSVAIITVALVVVTVTVAVLISIRNKNTRDDGPNSGFDWSTEALDDIEDTGEPT